jgi:hypothetical protein
MPLVILQYLYSLQIKGDSQKKIAVLYDCRLPSNYVSVDPKCITAMNFKEFPLYSEKSYRQKEFTDVSAQLTTSIFSVQ